VYLRIDLFYYAYLNVYMRVSLRESKRKWFIELSVVFLIDILQFFQSTSRDLIGSLVNDTDIGLKSIADTDTDTDTDTIDSLPVRGTNKYADCVFMIEYLQT